MEDHVMEKASGNFWRCKRCGLQLRLKRKYVTNSLDVELRISFRLKNGAVVPLNDPRLVCKKP